MLRALKTATLAAVLAGGALLGLSGTPAEAAPVNGGATVQTVQYYYGPPPYARPYYARPYYGRPYPRYYARRHFGPPPGYYGRPYRHHGRW